MKLVFRTFFWCSLLGVIVGILLFFYLLLALDSAEELRRGTVWGELLLRSSAIRTFPVDLVEGEKTYYLNPSGPNGYSSNALLIEVQNYEPEMLKKCEEWFLANGFVIERSDTAHTLVEMKSNDGRNVRIEVRRNDIIITSEHK